MTKSEECRELIIKEILKDPGREHSVESIKKVINADCRFTDGVLAGAFDELKKKKKIINVRRGFYVVALDVSKESNTNNLTPRVIHILNNAINNINEEANTIDNLSIEEEDLRMLKKIKEVRTRMLLIISELQGECVKTTHT